MSHLSPAKKFSIYFLCFYVGFETFKSLIIPVSASIITDRYSTPLEEKNFNQFSKVHLIKSQYSPLSRIKRSTNSLSQRAMLSREFFSRFLQPPSYRVFRPSSISETIGSDSWNGSQAVIKYKLNICLMRNITKASLNLTLITQSSLNLPLTLSAGFISTSTMRGSTPSHLLQIGSFTPNSENQNNRVSFDVLNFLQNITMGYSAQCNLQHQPGLTPSRHNIQLVFQIRRECEENAVICNPILDDDTRVPFIKVAYRKHSSNSNDSNDDEEIDNLLQTLRS